MTQKKPVCLVVCFMFLAHAVFCQNLLTYTNAAGKKVPVQTLFEWQTKRRQILDSMQALFGKLPGDHNLPPFNSRTPLLPPFNTQYTDSVKTNLYIPVIIFGLRLPGMKT